MAEKIRIVIADDHTIVRSGVRMLLETEPDLEVVGEAVNGEQALEMVEAYQPDLVLMDIAMPVIDGLQATRQIKARWANVEILVLTMHRSDEYFFEMLRSGASGYVLKSAGADELVAAVRAVARGEVFLYPSMAKKLLNDYLFRIEVSPENQPALSAREKEVLRMLAEGYSNKEIADKLVLSPSTVYTHRSNLMQKLGLDSRRELVQYARQHGLITENPLDGKMNE